MVACANNFEEGKFAFNSRSLDGQVVHIMHRDHAPKLRFDLFDHLW